ncbi:hypothetical protein FKP32DRAFT_272813 [Trametes sanguinea]|nr:hypothetical protein FKP32DRAFT_272813 [Trametes sanguinea]
MGRGRLARAGSSFVRGASSPQWRSRGWIGDGCSVDEQRPDRAEPVASMRSITPRCHPRAIKHMRGFDSVASSSPYRAFGHLGRRRRRSEWRKEQPPVLSTIDAPHVLVELAARVLPRYLVPPFRRRPLTDASTLLCANGRQSTGKALARLQKLKEPAALLTGVCIPLLPMRSGTTLPNQWLQIRRRWLATIALTSQLSFSSASHVEAVIDMRVAA